MTTIFPPTDAVMNFTSLDGWCLVVAGDFKGPQVYEIPNARGTVVFLSRERQVELENYFEFVKQTPWNHFARKNVAYLYAIANGAQFIWDFDDDNSLFPNETLSRYSSSNGLLDDGRITKVLQVDVQNNTECGVFNPSSFFRSSEQDIWPRGYPLDKINAPECQLQSHYCAKEVASDKIGIYQSLANKDPDVDAVYRLTRHLPVNFGGAVEDRPVVVPPHTMSPMNAQASLFARIGMWSMFLPTTVHGRVSDIWRSYIAQALAARSGMLVTFVGPLVTQDRNAHTYLADMEAERQLYERSGSLVQYLSNEWIYNHSDPTLEGAWERLYVDLYERGIIEWEDVRLAQLWASALLSVGYKFPSHDETKNVQEAVSRKVLSTDECQKWTKTSSPTKEKQTCGYDNVVLLGQFNFNTPASRVKFWVKRWREVFRHVEVRGPLDATTLANLRHSGTKAFTAEADSGWYSPVKNLAESLRFHAKDPTKCGVLMVHDDLLVNTTYLNALGFPSDSTIVAQYPSTNVTTPFATFYPDQTFKVPNNDTRIPSKRYKDTLPDWPWWSTIVPNITRAVEGAPGREVFANRDGGMDFFGYGQSDFLYVPIIMADKFASHAEWMVENEIMLEVAMPTIVARLQNQFTINVEEALLCTEWDYAIRDKVQKWLPKCYNMGPHGTYHPLKLSSLEETKWSGLFDKIVKGKA